ncbi:membrane protease FtsH catalytic subunit [Mycoplasma testudineum]|uniref:ATP-dependent zinc metalloprotease FtsH n=1 Tax=Mycoplasma testudineum TaxID=244584 RepID=A0A4R6IDX5_9MOLU|nr:ATP-dependent zinc metalloprotease FtsH [Mycoplasma testudineum]OYD26725.1 hypothetical protein CG473_02105 [Mycoplasma testudineum]TDO19861.1 membrane protease FtsH catalytic subunit [Mycoplasma testudineum]
MDNQNKKRRRFKFNWIYAILLILVAGWLIWFFAETYTGINALPIKTTLELQNDIIRAAQSTTDTTYISDISFTPLYNNIVVKFVQNGIEQSYKVGATVSWFNDLITTMQVPATVQGNSTGALAGGTYLAAIEQALVIPNSSQLGKLTTVANLPATRALSFLIQIGPTLLLILLFVGIFYFQMRAQSGGSSGIFNIGKNQAVVVKSDKKFSDVAGNAEAKEEIFELVDYLKNPKKYAASGARFPKGILLGGPPGTGKTLLAKATAGEANVPFFFISASSFVELYVGLGAKRVREMFKEARKLGRAIIFIDELDAVGRSRGSGVGGGNDEREQTLNQILVEMDGITENSGILIMAATNRSDVLDPALLRPGRFDRNITVGLPDVKEREEILILHAKGKRLSKEIDLARVAKRTPGFSGAQLENVINEASLLSVREKSGVIISSQIDEAIDRVMAGPAKKNRVISKEELTMVAYHEAGHAVAGIKIPGGNKVQKITIIPRGNAGGYNLMLPEKEKYNATKEELLATIASFMGGRAAEEIIYGDNNVSTGAADDIAKATKIARRMVTEWGMSSLGPIKYEENSENPFLGRDIAKGTFSNKIAHEIDVEVRNIIQKSQEAAFKIISENKELLELIKEALLQKETIVAEEIDYIAKNLKLPEDKPVKEKVAPKKTLDELIDQTHEKSTKEEN